MRKLIMTAAAALMLLGCKGSDEGALVDPALSTLVPADTTMLVGIRVEDLLKTQIYKKYFAERSMAPVDEFAKEMGLDPRKDLWEVLLITNGKDSVVLGRGKFSNEAEPRIQREMEGGKRFSYRGFTLIGNDETAVMLMGPSLAGVGATEGLKRIVDTRDKTNGPPAILAERMKEIPREAGFWSVYAGSPIDLPANASANMGNLVKILNSIQSGSFYADVRTNISAKATGIVETDQGAKELHDSLRGLLGLGRLMGAKDDVRLQRLFDGIRVTQDGKNVNLYIDESEDAIGTLMDLFNRVTPQGRAKGKEPAPRR